MPKTTPLPDWSGEDVLLIGGGTSLRGFDWDQLKPLNTIGCNQAFMLGSSICHVCTFGDWGFWQAYGDRIESEYGGWVATNYMLPINPSWVRFFKRQGEGLDTEMVAWNGNTGAAAINLALILGASRVLLLGYDCQMDVERSKEHSSSHWHDNRIEQPTPDHYDRFTTNFFTVAEALPNVFPGRQVINVSNGASRLRCFPIQTFESVGLQPPK